MELVPVDIECFVIFFADEFDFSRSVAGDEIESEYRRTRSYVRDSGVLIKESDNTCHVVCSHLSIHFKFSGGEISSHESEIGGIGEFGLLGNIYEWSVRRRSLIAPYDYRVVCIGVVFPGRRSITDDVIEAAVWGFTCVIECPWFRATESR